MVSIYFTVSTVNYVLIHEKHKNIRINFPIILLRIKCLDLLLKIQKKTFKDPFDYLKTAHKTETALFFFVQTKVRK